MQPSARRFWLAWAAGLVAWVAALRLVGSFDLRLSLAAVDPTSALGPLVARFGEWPGWLAVLAALALLLFDSGGGRRQRRGDRWRELHPLAWATLLLALLQPLLITQLLKLLWGRVRFVNLARDLSDYTPFWIPAGYDAGVSFPSGHVAMSMVPAPLPFHLWRRGHTTEAALAALGVLLVGATVAAGRVVAGKHYLTDTLFSLGLALLLAPLLLRLRRVAATGAPSTRARAPARSAQS